jgi:hypothetical protein
MHSETEDFLVEIEPFDIHKSHPKSFELYEEYSQKEIINTIVTRRDVFEKADPKIKAELEKEAEREVNDFRIWLEKVKFLDTYTAHYYSVSLKSLLLGLPVGIQVAYLFDTIINTLDKE